MIRPFASRLLIALAVLAGSSALAADAVPGPAPQQLIETTENLFILQALNAGANSEALRKFLHVDKWRITNVSKLRKRD